MKRLITISLAFLLLGASQTAMAGSNIDVMTQNQYLGADLTPVITAPSPPAFVAAADAAFNQIAANDFPSRAEALAELIANRLPHLVGLQEVFNFEVDPDGAAGPAPFLNFGPPFVDHLTETLNALAALGEPYVAVASVQNLDITLAGFGVPGFPAADIRIRDHDVILARADIAGFVAPFPFSAGCVRPSADGGPGCNYQFVAQAPLPFPPFAVNIERGFVGVTAFIDGQLYLFVNTHLEVQVPDPTNPLSPVVQAFQAAELIGTIAFVTTNALPPGTTPIVVGDINSSPDDPFIPAPGFFPPPFDLGIIPPYTQFVGSGYTDAWDLKQGNSPGFSCCELDDLSNPVSIHDERIDVIFSVGVPENVKKARVLGAKVPDKTPNPGALWPSDHGSVAAELQF